jgi:DNA-binding LytR/AlgR family response regulator
MSQAAISRLFIEPTDCKASFIGWGAYMSYLAIYCLLYTGVVESAPIELAESFVWVLREWGVWLVLTPLVFTALRALNVASAIRHFSTTVQLYALLGISALAIAMTYRVGIDVYGGADLAASAVYFFPKHATALILIVLAWHLARKTDRRATCTVTPEATPVSPNSLSVSDTLLVSTGQHESVIRIDEIDVISAAGNYVDIRCKDNVYLLRASLKQLEETLPERQFVRVHRSHLVNLSALSHITKTAAGNGSVVMRGGHVVPISKKYRCALKKTACFEYTLHS